MIRVQKLFGPESGLQTTHVEPLITFGRVAGNVIVIDHPNLSREHGELLEQDGHWFALNRSPNGTTINGRKIPADQPYALKPGDEVGVGKQRLFAVHFQPAPPPEAGAAPAPADKKPGTFETFRRAKNWILIGIVLLSVLGILAALMTGNGDGGGTAMPEQLPDQVIEQEIRRRPQVTPDQREAARHLGEAQGWYPRTASHEAGLYHAHRHYKYALAYSGKEHFDGIDQLHFEDVEQQLVDRTIDNYRQAYAHLRSREWPAADRKLRALQMSYPDSESQLWQNINRQLDVVRANRPSRRAF